MRSLASAIALVVVLALAGFVALRGLGGRPAPTAASGVPGRDAPAAAAAAAEKRAADEVARAMQAASAARDAQEGQ